jgi:hypothetical protein
MNLFAQRLSNAYFHANATSLHTTGKPLRKGQFMIGAYPSQHYSNEASARRQFNKVIAGESSGKKIEKRKLQYNEQKLLDVGRGLTFWHVVPHCKHIGWDEQPAETVPCEAHVCPGDAHSFGPDAPGFVSAASFTMQSAKYDNVEDALSDAEFAALVTAKIGEWLQHNSWPPIYWDVAVEIRKVRGSELPEKKRIVIDDLEIE